MKLLCETMGIQRSSFYNWKKTIENPAPRTRALMECIQLFSAYHARFPGHDCRWLNAKLRLDTGRSLTEAYARKCCSSIGVRTRAKHYRYRKSGETGRLYPNLLLSELKLPGPGRCIVRNTLPAAAETGDCSLTVYCDLWSYEICGWSLQEAGGGILAQSGAAQVLAAAEPALEKGDCALYAEGGLDSVLPIYSAAAAGTRGNRSSLTARELEEKDAVLEAVNGWLRTELLEDFRPEAVNPAGAALTPAEYAAEFAAFFNEARPLYALSYRTPVEYRIENSAFSH